MNVSTALRMKCISVFLLSAAAVCAADFMTGQAARAVIGQVTFTDEDPNASDAVPNKNAQSAMCFKKVSL